MAELALKPPQVTVTFPVPKARPPPIVQVQLTLPAESVLLGPRPDAETAVPVTVVKAILQVVFGLADALTVAI